MYLEFDEALRVVSFKNQGDGGMEDNSEFWARRTGKIQDSEVQSTLSYFNSVGPQIFTWNSSKLH